MTVAVTGAILTAALENGIMKFTDARSEWSHRQIDFNAPAVIQCARINRSLQRRGEMEINIVSELAEIDILGRVRGKCRKYLQKFGKLAKINFL